MGRPVKPKKHWRYVSPKKALEKLSERKVRSTKRFSVTGAIGGGAAGFAVFACPGGVLLSGFVGLLAGKIAGLNAEMALSRRALRKRLQAVVGRPKLASRLAESYASFPAYQKAILELGEIKLDPGKKSRARQRKRLAADKMGQEDIKYYFEDWIMGKISLRKEIL